MKIIVVGCGAAGATSAQFARKINRKAEIVIFDKEGIGQYSKCALPYVIAGMDWKKIIEFPPSFFERNNISYRKEEVKKIDFDGGIVECEGKDEDFDEIIIATGAEPARPFKAENVFFLRCLKDALSIQKVASHSKNAIVVGAGLIGLELAECLMKMGLKVKILEYMPSILPSMLDKDMADYLLKKIGIDVTLNCKVEETDGKKVFANGEYEADFVVVAVGNKPQVSLVDFASEAIEVDERCMAKEHVYAVGDCTKIKDFFGRKVIVGLGSIAVRQGMTAGINAGGGNEKMIPPVFAKTTKIFGMEIASVGLLANENSVTAKYIGKSLPHYMEGEDIAIKIIADKNGIIKGAQAIGKGASKIIDKITLAIYSEMHVKEVAKIENAYAPCVAPVFDAVSIACNMVEKKVRR
ncbi:MAG: hypothetical protein FE041_02250 [Thermoplasmata archaeon]|nr:MAG: hypothetical protein FE041_02250 [Thermoplasmata archaeon]